MNAISQALACVGVVACLATCQVFRERNNAEVEIAKIKRDQCIVIDARSKPASPPPEPVI